MSNTLKEQLSLIEEINRSCKLYFTDSTFFLRPSKLNTYIISGNNSSKALNKHGNSFEEVNAIKWFEDFWVYIEFKFGNGSSLISLSVFQGEAIDDVKNQLFRAEWDDYNNDNEKHPQPHWHITSNQGIEKTFEELAGVENTDTFISLLQEERTKHIDVSKIHFAMNGNWVNGETEIHNLSDKTKLLSWLNGLLSHLKIQLEYVK